MCISLRIIARIDVIALIALGGKIHTGRETLVRVSLGVHAVSPRNLHVCHRRLTLVDIFLITKKQAASKLVSPVIVVRGVYAPRALCIDLAKHLQVHIIIDSKIISSISQVKTARRLLTIRRHDKTTLIRMLKREEAVRHSQRQWHIGHHKIRRAKYDALPRLHLITSHFEVKMRMLGITCRILAPIAIHNTATITLCLVGYHKTLALLSIYIGDKGLASLKVVRHTIWLIRLLTLLKCRLALHLARRIRLSRSMHEA